MKLYLRQEGDKILTG